MVKSNKTVLLTHIFHFIQENVESGSDWKQGVESALQNGLSGESVAHVPGYDPKDKSYNNMGFEKVTHF